METASIETAVGTAAAFRSDLAWSIDDAGAQIVLARTGLTIRCAWRAGVDPQDKLDAKRLLARRMDLLSIIDGAIGAIRAGQSPEAAYDRADAYLDHRRRAEDSVWDACHRIVALFLECDPAADIVRAIPQPTDGLTMLAIDLVARESCDEDDLANLRDGALEVFGVGRVNDDGSIASCKCSELHGRGPCPTWPPFDWRPRAREVFNGWRTARVGGSIVATMAYLEGGPLLDQILAEIEAAGFRKRIEESQAEWRAKQ